MASIQDPLEQAKTGNRGDRISSLPDLVLVRILSFLPTKWGIATSILSTRWKHLWASVPIMVFDSLVYDDPELTSRFMNFVDRALFLHDLSSIQRFGIKCSKTIDMSRLNAWITVLIRRHIQEIDICISTKKCLKFPIDLFTCKSLVVLKLRPHLRLGVPSSILFSSLKTLEISLRLPNNQLTEKLFSSCPVLENLSIEGHIITFRKMVFNITSPVLKSLEMNLFTTNEFEHFASKIVVNAPALQHLTIQDDILCLYVLSNLSSLVEVNVSVGDCCMEEQGGTIKHANQVRSVVKEIASVKVLSLGYNTMAVLSYADDFAWPTFPNLTRLDLTIFQLSGWKRMPNLLARVPNLAVLILRREKGEGYCDHTLFEDFNWIRRQGRPACSFSNLKEINIFGFEGSKDEVELIKYLLQNAEVLEKMTIERLDLPVEEENEFLKKLLMFPRGSRSSQIQFA